MKTRFFFLVVFFFSSFFLEGRDTTTLKLLFEEAQQISERDEDPLPTLLAFLQKAQQGRSPLEVAVLESMQGEVLWTYMQQHWSLLAERKSMSKSDVSDVTTWTLPFMLTEALAHYRRSLQDSALLVASPATLGEDLLMAGNAEGREERPSLYDFLAYRALEMMSTPLSGFVKAEDAWRCTDPMLMKTSESFVGWEPQRSEAQNQALQCLLLYRNLTRAQQERKDTMALIALDLRRLRQVREWAEFEADSLYVEALEGLVKSYPEHAGLRKVYLALAEYWEESGNRYISELQEGCRWDLKKAMAYVERLQKDFGKTPEALSALAIRERICRKELSVELPEAVLPQTEDLVRLSFRTVDSVYFKCVELPQTSLFWTEYVNNREQSFRQYRQHKGMAQWSFSLPVSGDFQSHSVQLALPPLSEGVYVLFASSEPTFAGEDVVAGASLLVVSRLSTTVRADKDLLDGRVLDRKKGKPLSGVEVRLFTWEYNHDTRLNERVAMGETRSDKDGYFRWKTDSVSRSIHLELSHGKDYYVWDSFSEYLVRRSQAQEPTRPQERIALFTDRDIFRLGQTVFFKGICYRQWGDSLRVLPGKELSFHLLDGQGRELQRLTFVSNAYGSFAGRVHLPATGMGGEYSFQAPGLWHSFTVEEYKRPTFEVVLQRPEGAFAMGSKISLEGLAQTYSGSGLSMAKVKYKVTSQSSDLLFRRKSRWPGRRDERVVASDSLSCDARGAFAISFLDTALPMKQELSSKGVVYRVEVEVQHLSGEVQTATLVVPVRVPALQIGMQMDKDLNRRDTHALVVTTSNLSGRALSSPCQLTVYALELPSRILRPRLWEDCDRQIYDGYSFRRRFPRDAYDSTDYDRDRRQVWSQQFTCDSVENIVFEEMNTWDNGLYQCVVESVDPLGNAVINRKNFSVYDPSSRTPVYPEYFYAIYPGDKAQVGQDIVFYVGSALSLDLYVEIRNAQGVVWHERISLSKANKEIRYRPTAADSKGLRVQMYAVRDNRYFTSSHDYSFPEERFEWKLLTHRFRQALTPATEESWTFRLVDKRGLPLQAEVLASMYDASLDAYRDSDWSIPSPRNLPTFPLWRSPSSYLPTRSLVGDYFPARAEQAWKDILYDRLKWAPPSFYGGRGDAMPLMQRSSLSADASSRGQGRPAVVLVSNGQPVSSKRAETSRVAADSKVSLSPRRNKQETAFFYPQLHTDSAGEIRFQFQVPDALTRWRVRLLAHNRSLESLYWEELCETQKELMLFPNLPRFVREGDRMLWTTAVANRSDKDLVAQLSLELSVAGQASPNFPIRSCSLPAGETRIVSWEVDIPSDGSLLSYTLRATTPDHEDAESGYLPLLPRQEMQWASLPFSVAAGSKKSLVFEPLLDTSPTMQKRRLTLEITLDPLWVALQAMPSVAESALTNAIDILDAYVAHRFCEKIVHDNPEIPRIFEQWQRDNSEALQSPLENNADLKTLSLDETPWIKDAQDESQTRREVAQYFDPSRSLYVQNERREKLLALQSSNGGFCWIKGGRDDFWVSLHVLQGLAKLDNHGLLPADFFSDDRLKKALAYCDARMQEQEKPSKTSKAEALLSSQDLQYLLLRSHYATLFPPSESTAKILETMDRQVTRFWDKYSKTEQALLVEYFSRGSSRDKVDAIFQAWKKNSLYTEEKGLYWRDENPYSKESYLRQHCAMMDAYLVGGDTLSARRMQPYLLSSKRTRQWSNTSTSADAIRLLCMSSTKLLPEAAGIRVALGGKEIVFPSKRDAGSGHFKLSWDASEIHRDQAQIVCENASARPFWGGLYLQYSEEVDKVKATQNVLSVEKRLFVDRGASSASKELLEDADLSALQLGDKIRVRLVVRCDRPLDFVYLNDLRASSLEPEMALSSHVRVGGVAMYREFKDASVRFFIPHLPRGTHVWEYVLRLTQKGSFANGPASIQQLYAPEFSAHSEGQRITVR